MPTPLISIVMPAKNAVPYLRACLDSILEQSNGQWELCAVDDHSEDDTLAILEEYAAKDDRINVQEASGNGIIDALRQAWSVASGDYITRMDADDLMMPEKLDVMLNGLLHAGPGHLATGGVEYFSDAPLGDGYRRYADWLNGLTHRGNNFEEIYKECVIPSPSWMVSRDDFEKCGAFRPDTYPEDYDLCFRFYKAGLKVIPTDRILHRWRDYADRTSRTHEHYANNQFIKLKVHYFLELNEVEHRTLVVWGAGKKGKKVAKLLRRRNIPFEWVTNNPNKIGQEIYETVLRNQELIDLVANPQVLVCVANPEELAHIKSLMNGRGRQPLKDDFFFC